MKIYQIDKILGRPFFCKISTKMVGGFVAIVAIFSILGILISHELSDFRTASNEAFERYDAVLSLQDAEVAVGDQVQAQYELILENKFDRIDTFAEAQERRRAAIYKAKEYVETAKEIELFARLETTIAEYDEIFMNEVVPAVRGGDFETALNAEKRSDSVRETIGKLNGSIALSFMAKNEMALYQANKAESDAKIFFIVAAVVGLGTSLLITMIAGRRLSRPVEELKEAAKAMVKGDLDRRVKVTTNDEIGQLGASFNCMADSIRHEIEQLNNLSDIALAISSELDWEQAINIIMDKSRELTNAQAAAIVLYDEEHLTFAEHYSTGLSEGFVKNMKFRPGGLAEETLIGDRAVFSDDNRAKHGLSKLARKEGIRAFICLPLKVRQKKLGILYVYSKEKDQFDHEELSVLTILSNQAAIAIENAQLFERSQEEAVTDGLTGLHNQRYFYTRLQEELDRASRKNTSLSVLFCDLDRFKSFNDLNGHALGDKALKDVADIIEDSKRGFDIAVRYGGEEFALVLPETDSSGAQIIAHRIRRQVASHAFETRDSSNSSIITISIGVASYPEDGKEADILVDQADWSMYQGKRRGGDRVAVFHEESDEYGSSGLEELVREELNMSAIQSIVDTVDKKNIYNSKHAESVARMASNIAFKMQLDDSEIHKIRVAGLLHDIGLVGVPREIINKRSRLTDQEWLRIKEHPEIGATILNHISSLEDFLPAVRHHHEHYDGAGYPDGLKGDNIPLGARIIAVADAFQAMTCDRPYRKALTVEQAVKELRANIETQFDPEVVEVFISLLKSSKDKQQRAS